MGAIKANNYLNEELTVSLIGRAISHPARIKVLHKLHQETSGAKSIDLARWLNFNKSTMKNHLDMLKDAGLLEIEYLPH
ncbi:MAG: ArsR family transcriptional regulator [Bacteroidota bacterium]